MEIKAVIHEAEEGGYWAEVPSLPGCVTEADTLDELKANIVDAAQGWLVAQLPEGKTATIAIHGNKQFRQGTQLAMIRQTGIPKEEFENA